MFVHVRTYDTESRKWLNPPTPAAEALVPNILPWDNGEEEREGERRREEERGGERRRVHTPSDSSICCIVACEPSPCDASRLVVLVSYCSKV